MSKSDNKEISVPLAAATIMLLRDTDAGIEVFLLQRGDSADFPGAYVFPGGIAGHSDSDGDLQQYCSGLTERDAQRILKLKSGALSYWVTVIRECFEECGILLARTADGALVDPNLEVHRARFETYRGALAAGDINLIEVCRREQLTLSCSEIHYVSFWTTPEFRPRRYSTRFFVAVVPVGQAGQSDGRETVRCKWLRPSEALTPENRKTLQLTLPTIFNLESLLGFETAAQAVAAFEQRDTNSIPEIIPQIFREADGVRIEHQKTFHLPVEFEDD